MRRNKLALAAAGGALALGAALGTGAGTANADVGAQAWGGCSSGEICVYSGLNGTGSMCDWVGNDPDWHTGDERCTITVKSIWNRGTGGAGAPRHVWFHFGANYTGGYYACAAQNFKGNTGPNGGVRLRSHQWATYCR